MANNQRRTPGQRRAQPAPRKQTPNVVYTPGREFNRSRLILNLITVAAVAFAVFLGLSIFFKVETVTVTGAEHYSEWTIYEASGIQEGDNLLFFGQATASSKIIADLPYVTSVRFQIQLPGTVNIIIEEAPVAYSILCEDGTWWLMTSQGRLAEQVSAAVAVDHPRIDGVTLRGPSVGAQAVAAEDGQTAITGADRLAMALAMVSRLEANELFDRVTSVDVSMLQNLEFWCGQQFQVKLGDGNYLPEKIAAVRGVLEKMNQYQSGIIDASKVTEDIEGISIPCYPFPD
jgi:cell division protein FtsQ